MKTTAAQHTIEYDGERKTVEANRLATVGEVLELAWPGLTWRSDFTYDKVKCIATARRADIYLEGTPMKSAAERKATRVSYLRQQQKP